MYNGKTYLNFMLNYMNYKKPEDSDSDVYYITPQVINENGKLEKIKITKHLLI